MSTPPFLLAATAFFWAWQSGSWLHAALALGAALLLEGPRYARRRWTFTQQELYRVSDFCVALKIGRAHV